MKDFVVLFKPVTVPNNFDDHAIHYDNVHLSSLFQKAMTSGVNEASAIHAISSGYTVDEKTISFQTIGGKLCVVMLAFRNKVNN